MCKASTSYHYLASDRFLNLAQDNVLFFYFYQTFCSHYSADICVIPAHIKCTKDGKDSSEFKGTVCNRRLGFTCNGNVNYCKGFDVTITCPCRKKPGM